MRISGFSKVAPMEEAGVNLIQILGRDFDSPLGYFRQVKLAISPDFLINDGLS